MEGLKYPLKSFLGLGLIPLKLKRIKEWKEQGLKALVKSHETETLKPYLKP